ncbi:Mannose or cellobiose epimerase, N-acyl-D-glucosamine 2-epimerase family [Andreprevotia lacus DSM 23236]|jgi:mannose/cellobiose epimerase-like protein (N-acyl-D-glucosamine 2-epimerase family)|uniref:Mannose or cellobiose epimerase, N-acyl-D-glucosamine 2-epimerase family n=1 Tax=Andreprevotia lacus DSM 23236 TaxID=1121001 RepID=A0A1W1XFA8_9NEIS|nr:AGE family epimerase/isomerase [Andreprevotia lacus]SMC22181.1 Mannose or cellobiose epimerase, N-acyl-D-glucosamine 2-epimerase family [Andreprevotia lacus DSM 23236]
MSAASPQFQSRAFLLDHIRHTLSFYDPRAVDPAGGFFHFYKDDGRIYDSVTRHLVSSTRFVFNYAMAYRQFGKPQYLEWVRHGLAYLRNVHRNRQTGGYAWLIREGKVIDATNHCYGLAFVMLAYACGVKAGIAEARDWLAETYDLMEQRFWLPEHGVYASEASADWVLTDYRGQNDNMHGCEAMLAAYEATGEARYLQRAQLLASNFTRRQAGLTGGQVWEHFKPDWQPDLEYNKGDRTNIFRPWGFQTGHQTEWAKLLLILDRHAPADWHLPTARTLFDAAMQAGWDHEHGGLIYGYDLGGAPYDQDKYFWVQAESFAAAALLADATGEQQYWDWYNRIWAYSWQHFVDHDYGAWFRILTPENAKVDDEKSPAGKTDYHTMGACYEALNAIRDQA